MRLDELSEGERFEVRSGPVVEYRGVMGHGDYGMTHVTLSDGAAYSVADLQRACDESNFTVLRVTR